MPEGWWPREVNPTSEVKGSGLECQTATAQKQPRGATLRSRSGVAAGRSYLASEVKRNGQEELPHVGGQRRWLRGATLHPRSGAAAERSHPASDTRGDTRGQGQQSGEKPQVQGVVAAWAQESLEERFHVEGQEGWR